MKRVHYSWFILMVVFFSIIVAGIVRSASGVFVLPFEQQFGWSRADISLAFGIGLFMYGISGPFMGAFVQVFGIKRMMLISMGTLVVGLSSTYFMQHAWHLIIVWGIIIGIGSALFLTVLSPQIANRWFVKKRGLAVGILTASTATGQLVLLPVLAYVNEQYNWQASIMIILSISIVMFVLILFLMKESPKDAGILPYGGSEDDLKAESVQGKNPFKVAVEPLVDGLKNRVFWLLAGSFFICGLSTSGLIGTHFVSYCVAFGIATVAAASLMSLMGVFDLIGTTLSGWLSDRLDNRWLLFWYYLLRGLSLLLLPFALNSGSYVLLVIFAIFYGLDWIATVPPTVNLARAEFGLQRGVIIYGWLVAAHQLGAAVAAFGGGLSYEMISSYTYAFVGAGVMCFVASLFVILLKKPVQG